MKRTGKPEPREIRYMRDSFCQKQNLARHSCGLREQFAEPVKDQPAQLKKCQERRKYKRREDSVWAHARIGKIHQPRRADEDSSGMPRANPIADRRLVDDLLDSIIEESRNVLDAHGVADSRE